jgi:hypothetical protein
MKTTTIIHSLLVIVLIVVVFLLIVKPRTMIEGFTGNCPNVLMKYKGTYYLYNKNAVYVPGINPVRLKSLEEYNEIMDWMRSRGIQCPVLEVEDKHEANGERKQVVSVNKNNYDDKSLSYPLPFDPSDQTQGEKPSGEYEAGTDAMKDDWKGVDYTMQRIMAGDFQGDNVIIPK